jgi:hypothetical protein
MKVPLVFRILRVQVSSAFHVLEVRGVETLARDGLVDRDQRHALLGDVVHVPKSEYSWLALGGGNEEIDVAHAGRSDGFAVNDFEGLVLPGVEGGEHATLSRQPVGD